MRAIFPLCREHFPDDQVEAAGVHECGLADTTGIQLPALFAVASLARGATRRAAAWHDAQGWSAYGLAVGVTAAPW